MNNQGHNVYIDPDIPKKGRGVRARYNMYKGDIIEVCPVLLIPANRKNHMPEGALLWNYVYLWDDEGKYHALALGYGSLYNHSYAPNAKYRFRVKEQLLVITAIRAIEDREEICINYNYYSRDKTPVHFHVEK